MNPAMAPVSMGGRLRPLRNSQCSLQKWQIITPTEQKQQILFTKLFREGYSGGDVFSGCSGKAAFQLAESCQEHSQLQQSNVCINAARLCEKQFPNCHMYHLLLSTVTSQWDVVWFGWWEAQDSAFWDSIVIHLIGESICLKIQAVGLDKNVRYKDAEGWADLILG